MTSHQRSPGSIVEALNQLNIIAATAMGLFFMVSLVMVGLAGPIVEWMEAVSLLPLSMSLLLMVVAFMSSGSRSLEKYHWAEKCYVGFTVFLMVLFTWAPFYDLVMSMAPFGNIFGLVLMCIATAVLAR